MKTAIQNLYQKILSIPNIQDLPMSMILEITTEFNASLSEEKQNIINSVTHGNRIEFYDATETAGELYYTSTYTTNKETLK